MVRSKSQTFFLCVRIRSDDEKGVSPFTNVEELSNNI